MHNQKLLHERFTACQHHFIQLVQTRGGGSNKCQILPPSGRQDDNGKHVGESPWLCILNPADNF